MENSKKKGEVQAMLQYAGTILAQSFSHLNNEEMDESLKVYLTRQNMADLQKLLLDIQDVIQHLEIEDEEIRNIDIPWTFVNRK